MLFAVSIHIATFCSYSGVASLNGTGEISHGSSVGFAAASCFVEHVEATKSGTGEESVLQRPTSTCNLQEIEL